MATLNVKIDPKTLECSLCLETVSDPRILPCGHTFCGLKSPERCLQKLDPENPGTIKCALCQTDHHVRAADVPPDIKCREILESLGSKKQEKRMCHRHKKKIVMRCKVDGELVCLSCIAGDHNCHQLEEVHKEEHKRLSDYWNKENAKLEDKQLKCKRRKDLLRKEVEYLTNQHLQEDSLDNQLANLITRRDAITKKLAYVDFNPDDEDITALTEYVNQLEATSENQQEASEDVRERSQQLIDLVDSRAPTYCQNIKMNSKPASTRPTPIPEMIAGPSTGAAKMPTASAGESTSRQDVGRRTLTEENVNCTTNILALGKQGKHYILGLNDTRWEQWRGRITEFRCSFVAIHHKEKVYIIGGFRQWLAAFDKVEIFHIRESKWIEGPELNIRRAYAAACFVPSQRSIYICGGAESYFIGGPLSSVEKLELDENGNPVGEWREITPMKGKRWECAAVAVGSQLFLTGGKDENKNVLSLVEIFDTETEEWKCGPQMKECRAGHAVEHYDGYIYAMGSGNGSKRIESCEKLDLQSWTWTSIKSMCVPRSHFGPVVANGKIFVVGGYTTGDGGKSVEIYYPLTNRWSTGPELPEELGSTKCVCW